MKHESQTSKMFCHFNYPRLLQLNLAVDGVIPTVFPEVMTSPFFPGRPRVLMESFLGLAATHLLFVCTGVTSSLHSNNVTHVCVRGVRQKSQIQNQERMKSTEC